MLLRRSPRSRTSSTSSAPRRPLQAAHQLSTLIALVSATVASAQLTKPAAEQAASPQRDIADRPSPSSDRISESSELRWQFSVAGAAGHAFSANLDNGPGSVAVTSGGGGVSVGLTLGQTGRLDAGASSAWRLYDFDSATGLSPTRDRPWSSTLWEHDISLRYSHFHTQQLASFYFGAVRAAGENGAEFDDSLAGVLGDGVRYQFSESFAGSLGVLAASRLEDDWLIVPLIDIDWRITDKWRLSSDGVAGAKLSYALSDTLSIYLAGEYDSHEWRLRERPGLVEDRGIAKHKRVPIGLGLTWSPTSNFKLDAKAGALVWQQLELEDDDGNTIAKTDADAVPFVGVGLTLSF